MDNETKIAITVIICLACVVMSGVGGCTAYHVHRDKILFENGYEMNILPGSSIAQPVKAK